MSSLNKLFALGVQEHNITYKIVTNDNIICNECVKLNRKPKIFCYYGPRLCTMYRMNGDDTYFNMTCDYGHHFICMNIL